MKAKTLVIIRDDNFEEMEVEQCIVVVGKTTSIVAEKLEEAAKKALEEISSSVDFDDEEELGCAIDEMVYDSIPYESGEYKVYVTDTILVE